MAKQVNLDQLFQQKFETYQVDVSPQMDTAMESSISKLKWRRWFKWIFGAIVLALLAFLVSPSFNSDFKDAEIMELSSSQVSDLPLEEANTQSKEENVREEIEGKPIIQQEEGPLVVNEQPTIADSSNDPIIANKEMDFEPELQYSEPFMRDMNPESIPSYLDIKEFKVEFVRHFPENNGGRKNFTAIPLNTSNEKKQNSTVNGIKTNKSNQKRQSKIKSQASTSLLVSNEKTTKVVPQKKKKEKSPKKKSEPKVPKERKPSDFTTSIDIGISPILFKNLSPPFEPQNDTVTNFLTNKDSKLSYDFGFEILFKQKESDWLFKTGLHYQRLKEDINYYFLREYIDENQSHWIYDSIFEYHIDPPVFDTVLVGVDSSYYEHWIVQENEKQHVNQYTYLNIPLLIGYQIKMPSNKLQLHVLTGASMSILINNDGYYYDLDGYIHPYPNDQKVEIHWNLIAQMALYYQWEKIALYAKPNMQFQIGKKDLNEYFEKRQYLIYGIEFGLRIRLF